MLPDCEPRFWLAAAPPLPDQVLEPVFVLPEVELVALGVTVVFPPVLPPLPRRLSVAERVSRTSGRYHRYPVSPD